MNENPLDMSVDNVRKALIGRFGRDISDLNDAQDLAEAVQAVTGETISYNTIRRLFGLVKHKGSISRKTINILCRYLGYDSYEEFLNLPLHQKEISAFQSLMNHESNDFEINYAEQLISKRKARDILSLSFLLKYLLAQKEYSKVARILSKAIRLRLTEDFYENCVALANFCGNDFLKIEEEKWLHFFLQKTSYPQIVLMFYSSIYTSNKQYYEHLRLLHRFSEDSEEKLFCLAGQAFRAIIHNETPSFLKYAQEIKEIKLPQELPTDLKARLLTVEYMQAVIEKNGFVDTKWSAIIHQFKASPYKARFLKEPVALFFLLGMESECRELLEISRFTKWEIRHWTENGFKQIFHIAQAYYSYLEGDFSLYLKHKSAVDRAFWFASIHDLLELMHGKLSKLV